MTTDDGGPAFPAESEHHLNDMPNVLHTGMSLRDWFAGQALAGWLASYPDEGLDDIPATARGVADFAYLVADAMLAARAKGGE